MNVLAVLNYLTRKGGGIYDSARQLQQETARQPGVSAMACGLDDEFIDADLPAWGPVPVQVFKARGLRQFPYSSGLRRYLLDADVDVVHTHGLWAYPSVAVSAWHRTCRRPYLISPHGMLDPWAVKNSGWKKQLALAWFEREHLENAACLRALCEPEARAMRQFGLKNPICIVPNGVSLPLLEGGEPGLGAVSPFRSRARGRKVLLYLGRIHPKKGLANLLLAWKKLLVSRPALADSWMLAIAGWDQGRHESELQTLAVENMPGDSICFLGPQFGEAKAACYRECDAFILPSVSEGLPLVVLEAWSYVKPVVMTGECNLPEGFVAEAALKIEPNPQSIGRGLLALDAMSAEERQAMGRRGFNLVQDRFVWPHLAIQMQGVYSWVTGQGPRPEGMFKG